MSVTIGGSFVAGQIRLVCLNGHLDSVELTASNAIVGSKTGDDLFLFLENTSILGKIY